MPSDSFDSLLVSVSSYNATTRTAHGICYMADGRHLFRVESQQSLNSGTVYTAPESSGELPDTPSGPMRTVMSDEGDVFTIEDFASFNTSGFDFKEFLSFDLKSVGGAHVVSLGNFVNAK